MSVEIKSGWRSNSVWLLLSLVILAIDLWTKHLASSSLKLAEPQVFLPYFNFTLLHNYGAAFSFLSDGGGWQRWFFGVVAFLVSIFLVVWLLRLEANKRREAMAIAFILGGAVGNLWDRISLGYVVDFIDWFYTVDNSAGDGQCLPFFYARLGSEISTCHWPAFNIADAAILFGAFLLILDLLLAPKK